jgi:hypothetical protein
MTERFLRVTEPECGDLDAALAFVVRTIENEGFDLPNVRIEAFRFGDDEFRYEASVSGLITDKDDHA